MHGRLRHRSRAFISGPDGRAARYALVLAIMFVLAMVSTGQVEAQRYSEKVVYSFSGDPPQGTLESPSSLLRDAQGNFYGVGDVGTYEKGMVWKLDSGGKLTVLYTFTGTGGDGDSPNPGLVRDAMGDLYGTTAFGGDLTCGAPLGCGIVFKVDPTGRETILHTFTGSGGDGAQPVQGLTMDPAKNLYGTTLEGGGCAIDSLGCGTVFKIDIAGNETVLHSFAGTEGDGSAPEGILLYAHGNLYGTTLEGGDLTCPFFENFGCGTVFKMDTSGDETVLYSFKGTGGDGTGPLGSLAMDRQGNLYGTTTIGGDLGCPLNGAGEGCGTVFKVDTSGNEAVLYSFTGSNGDGARPQSGVVRGANGNLYGATLEGGLGCEYFSDGCGTVFEVSATGKETVLYAFTGNGSGAFPNWVLAPDAQGNLFGTTTFGGEISSNCGGFPDGVGCGTVFELSPLPATTTTLTSSADPSSYGQTVTFASAVTSSAGPPPDGGIVSFMHGKMLLGTGDLSNGSASFTTSALPVGTYALTAVYGGDSDFNGSQSKPVRQIVGKATTTTALTSSLNPLTAGQWVTFAATVTPEFSGTVNGRVDFYDGTTLLKSVALSLGEAEFTTSRLSEGTHTITAAYSGSADYTVSSAPLTQTVN